MAVSSVSSLFNWSCVHQHNLRGEHWPRGELRQKLEQQLVFFGGCLVTDGGGQIRHPSFYLTSFSDRPYSPQLAPPTAVVLGGAPAAVPPTEKPHILQLPCCCPGHAWLFRSAGGPSPTPCIHDGDSIPGTERGPRGTSFLPWPCVFSGTGIVP